MEDYIMYQSENVILELARVLNDVAEKTNTINKRLCVVLITTVIAFSLTISILGFFYFVANSYPDTSKETTQEITKDGTAMKQVTQENNPH